MTYSVQIRPCVLGGANDGEDDFFGGRGLSLYLPGYHILWSDYKGSKGGDYIPKYQSMQALDSIAKGQSYFGQIENDGCKESMIWKSEMDMTISI